MINIKKLINYLDTYLETNNIKDYTHNGLQVEGNKNISKIAYGVSASLELFKNAHKKNCNTIIVHHGLFWGDTFSIKTYTKKRLSYLLKNNINLLAYHLPLDRHKIIGNNISLINLFNCTNVEGFGLCKGKEIGYKASFNKEKDIESIIKVLKKNISKEIMHYNFKNNKIKTFAIVSGGATSSINEAIDNEIDLFISGENSEYIQEICRETGISFISLGHYNSEKLGILNLKKHIEKKFQIKGHYIDVPNNA